MPTRPTARSRASKARRLPTRGNATQAALAERILAWLRQQDLKPGDHVPERLATEAFHVSRTPVRAALALLTERGLLERRDQRGYFVARGLESADHAVPAETPESALHDAILRDRFSKRLDAEVTAAHLARRYHASRAAGAARSGPPAEGWRDGAGARSALGVPAGARFPALAGRQPPLPPDPGAGRVPAARLRARCQADPRSQGGAGAS